MKKQAVFGSGSRMGNLDLVIMTYFYGNAVLYIWVKAVLPWG